MRPLSLILGFLFLTASAFGQYGPEQAQTLAGIERVLVRFTNNQAVGQQTEDELKRYLFIELRRTGFQLVDDWEKADAIMNVGVYKRNNFTTADVEVRMDVEQVAELWRTKQSHWMVTWYYEGRKRVDNVSVAARKLLEEGVNRLLVDYLSN